MQVTDIRPFEQHVAQKTSDRILHISREISDVSWKLDEALRGLRIAQLSKAPVETIARLTGEVLLAYQTAETYLTRHWRP